MLQSMILSGAALNEWIRVLVTFKEASLVDLQLQCLRIQGSGRLPAVLSHASVLCIHQLSYLNPLMDLVMKNVCFLNERDSEFVRGHLLS